jgi:hypothetical protein
MPNEPVLTVASIQAVIGAAFIFLASYGLSISTEQRAGILGLYVVVAPIVFGIIARARVTPTVKAP